MGREFGHRARELVARDDRRREVGDVFLHRLGLVGGRRHADIAGIDAPLRGALWRGDPAHELEGGFLLGLGRLFREIEIAAACWAARLLAGRQNRDAEGEFGVGADIGEVAGGGPHHRDLLLEEVARRGAPFDDAGRVDLVLLREVDPVLQRLDHAWIGIIGLVAGRIGEDRAGLGRKTLEQPVGEAGRGDLDAPLRDVAGGVALGQLLRELDLLGPGLRRLLRIEAGLLEQVLVPVEHHGGALERDAPSLLFVRGLAAGLAVLHEAGIEAGEPLLVLVGLDEVVEGHDRLFVDQREHVGREQHRKHRRGAALMRGQRLDDGLLIGAGIDRLQLDRRVVLLEVGGVGVDQLGDRPADGDRIEERELGGALRPSDAG